MSSSRGLRHFLVCSVSALLLPMGAGAQTGVSMPSLNPDQPSSRMGIVLFGGWSSFSQTRVNELIRIDNMLLTSSVKDGGAGLESGLDQINDGITFGAEVRFRLKGPWEAVAGFERLRDQTRLEFEYDSGSGPMDSYLQYETDDWPVHAGIRYSFRFSDRFAYGIGLSAVIFPVSRLHIAGRLGNLASLDREGTVSGLGAALTWGGEMALSGPLTLQGMIRLRFGRVGDPKDASGNVITDPLEGKPITLDWSGVDIVVGILIDLF